MTKLLYITANPKPENQSYSLTVGRAFLDAYRQEKPTDQITELDLYKTDIPLIDNDVLNGWGKLGQGKSFDELTPDEKTKIGKINQFTDQFVNTDKYVFATPMWNLSLPPKVKAYIDTICIAGKTFQYTEKGPEGLMKNKKAVHIQASGGVYSEGPGKNFEFGNSYLHALLTFLGISSIASIFVEGAAQAPDKAEEIKNNAIEKARQVAKSFAAD